MNTILLIDNHDASSRPFTPSRQHAHEEILRILKENDPNTVAIVALGPMTNLALAAAQDTKAFLRVKEVVVMGGAIEIAGNVSRHAVSQS
jgi:inosine-uridine nucleoside N-ribohydrolase